MRLPAPGLFSTKNCWPKLFAKCSASTRPTMSVPPAGGDGTMMRTGRGGESACASACPAKRDKMSHRLTDRMQNLSVSFNGLRRHEHESDDTGLGAGIHPVVQRRL